jgi:hypothetical protein
VAVVDSQANVPALYGVTRHVLLGIGSSNTPLLDSGGEAGLARPNP